MFSKERNGAKKKIGLMKFMESLETQLWKKNGVVGCGMGVSQDGRVREKGIEGEGAHTSKKDREEGVSCDPLAVEVAAAAANESLKRIRS